MFTSEVRVMLKNLNWTKLCEINETPVKFNILKCH